MKDILVPTRISQPLDSTHTIKTVTVEQYRLNMQYTLLLLLQQDYGIADSSCAVSNIKMCLMLTVNLLARRGN